MRDYLGTLGGKSAAQVDTSLRARAAQDQPFDLTVSGQPTLRVVWRTIVVTPADLPSAASALRLAGTSSSSAAP